MEIKVKITKKDMMDEKTRQNLAEILSSCYKVICEQTKQDLPKMKTKEKKEKQAQEETKEPQDEIASEQIQQDQEKSQEQQEEQQDLQEQDTDEQVQYSLKELRQLARKKAKTIEKGQKKVMAVIEKYTQGAETNIVNVKKRDYNAIFQDLEGLE